MMNPVETPKERDSVRQQSVAPVLNKIQDHHT